MIVGGEMRVCFNYRRLQNEMTTVRPLNGTLNTERSYITKAEVFSLTVTNPSFNVLFEMSQSQPLQTGVCFMSILCK